MKSDKAYNAWSKVVAVKAMLAPIFFAFQAIRAGQPTKREWIAEVFSIREDIVGHSINVAKHQTAETQRVLRSILRFERFCTIHIQTLSLFREGLEWEKNRDNQRNAFMLQLKSLEMVIRESIEALEPELADHGIIQHRL